MAGRLLVVVVNVVPVVRGIATMVVDEVNWNDGSDVDEVRLSEDEDDDEVDDKDDDDNVGGGGARVDSGPRV